MPSNRLSERIRARYLELTPARRIAVVALAVIILLSFFMLLTIESGHEHDGDHAVSDDGTIWTCSMHPQIRQPNPGNCPICGMTLIPATTDEPFDDDLSTVRLVVTERAAALMDVRVWPAERRDLEHDIRLFGRIAYDETRLTDVTLRVDGQIEQLHVAFENAPVQAGAPVAEVFSPAVQAAGRELVEAVRIGDERLTTAARDQLSTLGLSSAQIDRIQATGDVPRTFTVSSPTSGIVSQIDARRGDWVAAGGRILRIAGIGQVWVELEAYESDVSALTTGQRVFFEAEAIAGERFEGTIAFIDPALAADRRTVRVRVNAANPGGRLRPGMFVRARVAGLSPATAPVVIPASAPLITGRRAVVYVRLPDTDRPTFEPRDVLLGERSRDHVAVLEGLEEGELVVVNGAFKIDSELQIRGRPSMMSPEERFDAPPVVPHVHGPTSDAGGSLENVDPLFNAYRNLVEALAADRPATARAAAYEMSQAVNRVQASSPAESFWGVTADDLRDRLRRAQSAESISDLRSELGPLTEILHTIADHPDTDRTAPVHVAYCPMAPAESGGQWLAHEPDIRNPYFGESMLSCGEITGTL
jgi:membrane fusion protein, copper/silver efflux system